MPYFKWRGISSAGTDCKGYLFAPTYDQLDALLFKRKIALLEAQSKKIFFMFHRIKEPLLVGLFEQLWTLLNTGLRLHQTLVLIAQQHHNPRLQEILYVCIEDVDKGNILSNTLKQYPSLFDSIVIQNVRIGEQSGRLASSCKAIYLYLQRRYTFKAKIRSLLYMPCITFVFFLGVTGIIFGFMIPQFSSMFNTLGQELPTITVYMIHTSSIIRSRYFLGAMLIIILTSCLLCPYVRSAYLTKVKEFFLKHIPFVRYIMMQQMVIQFSYTLAILLESGVPLTQAIGMLSTMHNNIQFNNALVSIHNLLLQGTSFSDSLIHYECFFPHDMVTIIAVAQEAHALPTMLYTFADDHQKKLDAQLHRVTLFIQPLLIIILGLLVALLIISIYTPIMNIAYRI